MNVHYVLDLKKRVQHVVRSHYQLLRRVDTTPIVENVARSRRVEIVPSMDAAAPTLHHLNAAAMAHATTFCEQYPRAELRRAGSDDPAQEQDGALVTFDDRDEEGPVDR